MPRARLYLFLHWIPAMIGIAAILAESTGTMSSQNTSQWLLPIWTWLFGPIAPDRWDTIHFFIRKTGHFAGYGVVSLGFFEGWRATFRGKARSHGRLFATVAILALVCTLVLASWDEWHQSLLPGRTSKISDVGIDVAGAIMAHLVLFAILMIVWRMQASRANEAERQISSQV